MKRYAIIVAGGTGSRMQGDIPKQFMLLKGKPILQHSLEAFHAFDPILHIILVIHPDYLSFWDELSKAADINIQVDIVSGGENRFTSVKNGLQLIEEDGMVAIHDAARPFISKDFIESLFKDAALYGSALPAIPLTDTIRVIEGDNSRQLDRTLLRAMQTPQVFNVSELKRAYIQPFNPMFTDDASVMESAGFAIHITDGSPQNFKITNPLDLAVAEVLKNRQA